MRTSCEPQSGIVPGVRDRSLVEFIITGNFSKDGGEVFIANIIIDSGCDVNADICSRLNVTAIPFTMLLGSKEFVDDESFDKASFMDEMKAYSGKVASASPSPYIYQKAIEKADASYVLTLSSQLSGSYNSAMLAKSLAEENGDTDTYVFDTKSASAGETLAALKLHELLSATGNAKEQIVKTMHDFIDNMKTYFVLENYDNLQKNGRLGKLKGSLIQVLNIKLIMGSDSDGNIALYEKVRGTKQLVDKLLGLIEKSGKNTAGERLVISHCNNPDLADKLLLEIESRFRFKEIFVVPTGGLSSLYTDDKGVVLAF